MCLRTRRTPLILLFVPTCFLLSATRAWLPVSKLVRLRNYGLRSSEWNNDAALSSNDWQSSLEGPPMDWQDTLKKKEDGSFWTSFEETTDDEKSKLDFTGSQQVLTEDRETEAWLDTLASISAEEVQFNMKEADRANTARQMEEWGFDKEIIAAALDISTDTSLEQDEVKGMDVYREESYLEEVDLATVESHTRVEIDEETGEPVRAQMVYVDEHTCIGCTNCAMIAQSTFYMNPEHGRARVFQVRNTKYCTWYWFIGQKVSQRTVYTSSNGEMMMKPFKLQLRLVRSTVFTTYHSKSWLN